MALANSFERSIDEESVDAETEFYNVPDQRIIDMLAEADVESE
jgi:hypothetical protein